MGLEERMHNPMKKEWNLVARQNKKLDCKNKIARGAICVLLSIISLNVAQTTIPTPPTITFGDRQLVYDDNQRRAFQNVESVIFDCHCLMVDQPVCSFRLGYLNLFGQKIPYYDFMVISYNGADHYSGSSLQPFGAVTGSQGNYTAPNPFYSSLASKMWKNIPDHTLAYVPNIYQVPANPKYGGIQNCLLGFVHIEQSSSDAAPYPTSDFYLKCNYKIGLAISSDQGKNWTYLGDIIQPAVPLGADYTAPDGFQGNLQHNIAGVPYVVVGDYFYVYFDEYPSMEPPGSSAEATTRMRSVARGKIDDILSEIPARLSSINSSFNPVIVLINGFFGTPARMATKWQKYLGDDMNGAALWSSDAMAGSPGGEILKGFDAGINNLNDFDLHADAVYCSSAQAYLMSVNTAGNEKLLLYYSRDGLKWYPSPSPSFHLDDATDKPCVLEDPVNNVVACWAQYNSFFAPAEPTCSADCHEVTSQVYMIWPRKFGDQPNATWFQEEFWGRLITITPSGSQLRNKIRLSVSGRSARK
jgi:hypothetical protein